MTKRGPKTPEGKANSAANSTIHGLRSDKLTTQDQKAVYDSFLQELVDYYSPEGPLELLELERIATCKAKLQILYALENAKIKVLLDEYESDPQQLLKKYSGIPPVVKGMIYEMICWGELVLPCELHFKTLRAIHDEIQSFSGELSETDDLKAMFPVLVEYVMSFESEEVLIDKRLMAISEKIRIAIERGENYCEYLSKRHYGKYSDFEEEKTSEDIEFEKFVEEIKEANRAKYGKKRLNIEIKEDSFMDVKQLQSTLKPFSDLYLAAQHALHLIDQIQSFIETKKAALSLPQDEADLLLRYQTAWERRLSTAIGEFLKLRELAKNNGSRVIEK